MSFAYVHQYRNMRRTRYCKGEDAISSTSHTFFVIRLLAGQISEFRFFKSLSRNIPEAYHEDMYSLFIARHCVAITDTNARFAGAV